MSMSFDGWRDLGVIAACACDFLYIAVQNKRGIWAAWREYKGKSVLSLTGAGCNFVKFVKGKDCRMAVKISKFR
jgi:hypothetical protein